MHTEKRGAGQRKVGREKLAEKEMQGRGRERKSGERRGRGGNEGRERDWWVRRGQSSLHLSRLLISAVAQTRLLHLEANSLVKNQRK